MQMTKNNFAKTTVEQHQAITDAISSADAQGARYAMITHLNSKPETYFKSAYRTKIKWKVIIPHIFIESYCQFRYNSVKKQIVHDRFEGDLDGKSFCSGQQLA